MVWAARRVGRPVKWTGDRTEAFLTDYTARDVVTARGSRSIAGAACLRSRCS